jgi:hypothetical protein
MENFSVLFEPLVFLEENGSLLMDLSKKYKKKEKRRDASF